jgi:hypothetical protein
LAVLLPVELASAIEQWVAELAAGRGSASTDIARRLDDYGRTPVPLPPGWQTFAWQYDSGRPGEMALDVDLWTLEEGRSDLTLQLLARRDGEKWTLQALDLGVL